jgi:archaellum biogenesis ATPase FlaH
MADTEEYERAVLSITIKEGAYKLLAEHRVAPDWFEHEEDRRIFEWIVEHYGKYGSSPGLDALKANYPAYRLVKTTDSLEFYIGRLRDQRKYTLMRLSLNDVNEELRDGDVAEAERLLGIAWREVSAEAPVVSAVDVTLTVPDRIEMYRDWAKSDGGLRGRSTGFASIDRATRGVQPGQFIVIIGDQKAGKSTLLMKMGEHMNSDGARILLFTFEMGHEEQAARHDAIRARVSHGRLLDGRITRDDVLALRKMARAAEDGYPFLMATDTSASTTVSQIGAQIEEHKPDVCLIDGLYFIDDEWGEPPNTPLALTHVSRDIGRLVRHTKVPIIGTTQALASKIGAKGITHRSTGYSSAWGQDCHVMIGMQEVPDHDDVKELRVLLSRSGPRASARINFNYDTGNFEEREIDADPEEQTTEKRRYASSSPKGY